MKRATISSPPGFKEVDADGFHLQHVVILCICLLLVSSFRGSSLLCDLTFLTDLRRVLGFSVCSACCLLGHSVDF